MLAVSRDQLENVSFLEVYAFHMHIHLITQGGNFRGARDIYEPLSLRECQHTDNWSELQFKNVKREEKKQYP